MATNNLPVHPRLRAPQQLGGTQNPYLKTSGQLVNNGVHVLQNDTRFIGSECALSSCVRRVQASISRGEYSEKVLDTFSDFGEYAYGSSIVLSPPWEEGKNFTITQNGWKPSSTISCSAKCIHSGAN